MAFLSGFMILLVVSALLSLASAAQCPSNKPLVTDFTPLSPGLCVGKMAPMNKSDAESECREATGGTGELFDVSDIQTYGAVVKALKLDKLNNFVWLPARGGGAGNQWIREKDGKAVDTTLPSRAGQCLLLYVPQSERQPKFKFSMRYCWRSFPALCAVRVEEEAERRRGGVEVKEVSSDDAGDSDDKVRETLEAVLAGTEDETGREGGERKTKKKSDRDEVAEVRSAEGPETKGAKIADASDVQSAEERPKKKVKGEAAAKKRKDPPASKDEEEGGVKTAEKVKPGLRVAADGDDDDAKEKEGKKPPVVKEEEAKKRPVVKSEEGEVPVRIMRTTLGPIKKLRDITPGDQKVEDLSPPEQQQQQQPRQDK